MDRDSRRAFNLIVGLFLLVVAGLCGMVCALGAARIRDHADALVLLGFWLVGTVGLLAAIGCLVEAWRLRRSSFVHRSALSRWGTR
jgi:uncharacterized membrane protein